MSRPQFLFTKEELLAFCDQISQLTDVDIKYRIKHDKLQIWDDGSETWSVFHNLRRA